jgi:hypothetical protein
MWRKGEVCTLVVGIEISAAIIENSMKFLQKKKNRTIT